MTAEINRFSFFYRDGFNLSHAFPDCHSFRMREGDGHIQTELNGDVKYSVDRVLLTDLNIHPIIEFSDKEGVQHEIQLHIRSWKNSGPKLVEVTQRKWLKTSRLHFYLNLFAIKYLRRGYSTILLTKNGTTYYSDGHNLCGLTNHKNQVISSGPKIDSPIYNEMLVEDNYGFIRTDKKLYFSEDNLRTWILIYEGKRGIKDSILWLPDEKELLFSEYSPGLDFQRHNIYKFSPITKETRTVFTFYTREDNKTKGLFPYCRHIHCMQRDPYTGHIYLGVGDLDEESAIYRSTNNGDSFELVGGGSQNFRTLSFLFTQSHIIWNTDSGRCPQYLHSASRANLNVLPLDQSKVVHYPLINSASWNSFHDEKSDLFIMSSSCEGCHYDDCYRVFGIKINNGEPIPYCLFEEQSKNKPANKSDQLFVLGMDINDVFWFYDTINNYYRQFVLLT